jgi:tetratricopeptide (TPR) repeat protein
VSRPRVPAASAILLGGALAGVAFVAAGGTELGRTTLAELPLVLAGGGLVAAALLLGSREPLYGATTVAAFGALAAVTGLSVAWSIAPELSYVEAGRTLAYLGVFAAAVAAAHLWPRAAPVVLKGLLLGAVAVVVYSLASRVWPATLAETEASNRLQAPFDYWNAVGTTAALAVPAALWLGGRRIGGALPRALAYPALGLCFVAIMLTQSRGALAAAVLGGAAWFALVPLRLRSLPVLILPALAAAPVSAWALSKDAFSKSLQPLAAKESVAGEFGLLLVVMASALLVAGLAVNFGLARTGPPVRLRRRIGIAAAAAAALVPLALFTSVAFSERGLSGTIGDRVDELTSDTSSAPSEGAGRFAAASSTRGKYWREAGKVFGDRPAVGTGAGTFGLSRLRYRTDEGVSRHAHGYVVQTLADTGLIGLAATLALLAAWLAAAARTTGLVPRLRRFGAGLRRRDWDSERIALVALTLVALVFGLQSAIDWTWFVPGPAVMALVAAGFVAGRGPVGTLAGAPAPALAGSPAPAGAAGTPMPATGSPAPAGALGTPAADGAPDSGRSRRPSVEVDGGRLLAAAGVAVCALLFAWAVWQPEASDRASNHALELSDAGDYRAALAAAGDAGSANPLSPRPLLVEAAIQTEAGDVSTAGVTLEQAVLRFPGDPQTWLRLASFQLGTLDRPDLTLSTLQGALYLDPLSKPARALYLAARARARAKEERAARARAKRAK